MKNIILSLIVLAAASCASTSGMRSENRLPNQVTGDFGKVAPDSVNATHAEVARSKEKICRHSLEEDINPLQVTMHHEELRLRSAKVQMAVRQQSSEQRMIFVLGLHSLSVLINTLNNIELQTLDNNISQDQMFKFNQELRDRILQFKNKFAVFCRQ